MSDFLTYEHESGEILFIKRSAIASFHPKYVHPKGYIIYAVVGDTEKPIHKCTTKDEAKAWVEQQIEILGGSVGVRDKVDAKATRVS